MGRRSKNFLAEDGVTVLRPCSVCTLHLPLSEFHDHSDGRGRKMAHCKTCGTKAVKRSYYKHLIQRRRDGRAQQRERTRAGRDYVNQLKAKTPCKDCEQIFPPVCMDFDHRPGTAKVAAVSAMLARSPKELIAEIAKCDLVCACCHRLRTTSRSKHRKPA